MSLFIVMNGFGGIGTSVSFEYFYLTKGMFTNEQSDRWSMLIRCCFHQSSNSVLPRENKPTQTLPSWKSFQKTSNASGSNIFQRILISSTHLIPINSQNSIFRPNSPKYKIQYVKLLIYKTPAVG